MSCIYFIVLYLNIYMIISHAHMFSQYLEIVECVETYELNVSVEMIRLLGFEFVKR